MADVRVQVQNTTRRTWTSGSGGYTFWAVSSGRYKLTASKTGNSSSTRTVVVQRGVKSW